MDALSNPVPTTANVYGSRMAWSRGRLLRYRDSRRCDEVLNIDALGQIRGIPIYVGHGELLVDGNLRCFLNEQEAGVTGIPAVS